MCPIARHRTPWEHIELLTTIEHYNCLKLFRIKGFFMIIIDTPFHVTFTSYTDLPSFSCTGKCKKSWFKEELENRNDICPMCASSMQKAAEGV